MKDLIGYCGLDCEKCEARIATVNNDDNLRLEIAKKWSELNNVEITKEMINCLGCRVDGPKTPYCQSMCEIKKCACKNKFETCANCQKLNSCKVVGQVIENSEDALKNLKSNK